MERVCHLKKLTFSENLEVWRMLQLTLLDVLISCLVYTVENVNKSFLTTCSLERLTLGTDSELFILSWLVRIQ